MKHKIDVILDNIRSAYNVGAMFRTSDGAGVNKMHLCGITPYPPHKRIPKTSLGAVENVEWEYYKSTKEAVEKLKSQKYKIVAVELGEGSSEYDEFEIKNNTAFIFGHEINGVGEEILKLVDHKIYIPMHGIKESLNVSTAFGIIVYDAVRKQKPRNPKV